MKEGLTDIYNFNKKLIEEKYQVDIANTKLKQTLTEIKEICKSVWGNGLDEEVDKFEQILQKISEVENG